MTAGSVYHTADSVLSALPDLAYLILRIILAMLLF